MQQFLSRRTLLPSLCGLALLLVPLWQRMLAPILRPPAIILQSPPGPANPASGFSMDALSFVQFQEGKQEILLTARHATSADTDGQILLTDVAAKVYDNDRDTIRLHSGEAIYDKPGEEITLRRSVRIETDDFTGTTAELHYFPEVKLAQTSDKIELQRNGLNITGTGLNYDIGAGDLVIGGNGRVRCVLD